MAEIFELVCYVLPGCYKQQSKPLLVGLNLFVTSGVAGMPMMAVVRAALPFLVILFVFLIMVTYIPWLSTFLPNHFMGPELIIK